MSKTTKTRESKKAPNGGKGRPPGATNKTTRAMKEAFVEAFDRLGGVPSLVVWGTKNRTEFYKLAARLIPTETHVKVGGDGTAVEHDHTHRLPPAAQALLDGVTGRSAEGSAAVPVSD